MPEKLYFPEYEATLEVATEQELLDFANAVREAGGADPIPALLPSYPQVPNACLIANALNFGCKVLPVGSASINDAETGEPVYAEKWIMEVDTDDLAIAIGSAVEGAEWDGDYFVKLPQHIGNAAAAFDQFIAFQSFDARDKEQS